MDADIFICGTCKQQFNDVSMYMGHKEMCTMANGHVCNYVTNQTHVTNQNSHCSVGGHLGSLNDPSLASAPVHHDHAYFHYEAPALVTSVHEVPQSGGQQPNTGLLMDMLSSLDSSQMAHSFTEQVVEEFMPPQPPQQLPPSTQPQPEQPVITMATGMPNHQHHHQLQHEPQMQHIHHQAPPPHHQPQHQHHQQQQLHHQQLHPQQIHSDLQMQPHQQLHQQLHSDPHQQHIQSMHPQIHHQDPQQQQQHSQHQQQHHLQHPQHQQQHLQQHQQSHQQHLQQHQQQQQSHQQQHLQQQQQSHQQQHLQQHQPHQQPLQQPLQQQHIHQQPHQQHPQHQQHHPQHQQQHLQQQHLQTSTPVYNTHIGVPLSSQPPAISSGSYLASVQRSEPVLVVSNGVLTYVSQPVLSTGMIDSAHLYSSHPPADIACPPGEIKTDQMEPSRSEPAHAHDPNSKTALPEAETNGDRSEEAAEDGPASGQLLSRMGTPRLQCPFCRRRFRRNFDLQLHVRSHTGEKPFQCIVCGRAFAQRNNVKRHMESHKVWPAAVSGSGTLPDIHTFEVRLAEDRQLIVRPTKSIDHVMERREYRVLCGGGRGGRSGGSGGGASDGTSGGNGGTVSGGGGGGRSTEETIVLVDNCWECRYCRSRFEDFQKLRSHMRQHSDQQVYLCVLSDCRQTFKQLDAFLEHLEIHQKKKEMVYVCHVCHKTFVTVQQLGEHYNDHCKDPAQPARPARPAGDAAPTAETEKVTYKCPECGHLFRRPAALQAHIVTVHKGPGGGDEAFTCSHCEKTFSNEASLRHHIQIHATLAQFQCSTCPKAFKTRQYLRIHERTEHEHNSPFTCSRCGRGFLSRPALRTHILSVHDPDKKLKCPLAAATGCLFETAHATSITSHLATHSAVLRRPYPCAHCGWRFANALLLRRHLRKHRNAAQQRNGSGVEGELRCSRCDRQFKRRVPFDNHVIMCRQAAAAREWRARRHHRTDCLPVPEPVPEAAPEVAVTETGSRRPQRKRKFTVLWKPKGQQRRKRKMTESAAAATAQDFEQLKSSSTGVEEEDEEEEASDGYEELAEHPTGLSSRLHADVYDPMGGMASIIGCEPVSSGPSLPGIATFNQAISAPPLVGGGSVKSEHREFLDISALVVRPPNQNAPYTCSEDLKLLDCGGAGEQFEETGRAGAGSVQF